MTRRLRAATLRGDTVPDRVLQSPNEKRELLARGFTSEIHPWGEGRVLKLFHSWVPIERARAECEITRTVHWAGLPAPDAFETIEHEGRAGIILERIDGVSMLERTQGRPWTLFAATRELARLHGELHRCTLPPSLSLPTQRERLGTAIASQPDLPESERLSAQRSLDQLPDRDTLCHGDFHPENILYSARGPIIIDWGTATRGHPLGDIANTCRLIRTAQLPPWTPAYMHLLLKVARTLIHRTYLRHSLRLQGAHAKDLQPWSEVLAVAARAWRIPKV